MANYSTDRLYETSIKVTLANTIGGRAHLFKYNGGDTVTPLASSANVIEHITKRQLVDLIKRAANLAQNIRSNRGVSVDDIMFLLRKDPIVLYRVKEFLAYKELRRSASKGGGNEGIDYSIELEDEMISQNDGIEGANGLDSTVFKQQLDVDKVRKKKSQIPWDPLADLVIDLTDGYVDLYDEGEEKHPEAEADTTRRLQLADSLTREMTRGEYMEYSECRQASFTFKKPKKFREWLNPLQHIDMRLSEEVVELLGFVAWEMVRRITEMALEVKGRDDSNNNRHSDDTATEGGVGRGCELFRGGNAKTAIQPSHINAALKWLEERKANNIARYIANPLPFRIF